MFSAGIADCDAALCLMQEPFKPCWRRWPAPVTDIQIARRCKWAGAAWSQGHIKGKKVYPVRSPLINHLQMPDQMYFSPLTSLYKQVCLAVSGTECKPLGTHCRMFNFLSFLLSKGVERSHLWVTLPALFTLQKALCLSASGELVLFLLHPSCPLWSPATEDSKQQPKLSYLTFLPPQSNLSQPWERFLFKNKELWPQNCD